MWFEYVASKANIADMPSRDDFELLHELASEWREPEMPYVSRFDDDDARQAAWWAVLAGAAGHTYGNNNVWQMWAPGRDPAIGANRPWSDAIDDPGARQMGLLRRFMEAQDFATLEPRQDLILDGPRHGAAKVRLARAAVGRRTAAPVVVMLQPDQVKARKPAPGFKNVPDLKARREAYAAKQAEGIDFSSIDPSTFTGVGLAASRA